MYVCVFTCIYYFSFLCVVCAALVWSLPARRFCRSYRAPLTIWKNSKNKRNTSHLKTVSTPFELFRNALHSLPFFPSAFPPDYILGSFLFNSVVYFREPRLLSYCLPRRFTQHRQISLFIYKGLNLNISISSSHGVCCHPNKLCHFHSATFTIARWNNRCSNLSHLISGVVMSVSTAV